MVFDSMPLGELISALYDHYLAMYGDEELAALATAAAINDLLEQNRFAVERTESGCSQSDQ